MRSATPSAAIGECGADSGLGHLWNLHPRDSIKRDFSVALLIPIITGVLMLGLLLRALYAVYLAAIFQQQAA